MIRNPRFRLTVTIVATVVLASPSLESDERASEWLTGRAFDEKLTQPATVLWEASPLREYLCDFGRAQRTAILVDRRVDPDQMLTLAVRDEPVLAVIQKAANSRNLRAAVLRNVIFVGDSASANRIRTVSELRRREIAALGGDASQTFSRQAPLAWSDLVSPRDLLGRLAEENGLEIVNLEQVPHDLWAAGELPSMSLAERLTLILHQFDLTFRVAADARRLAVIPLPQNVGIVRDYPGGSAPEALAQKWRDAYPNCQFRIAGNRIHVRGLVEDLDAIEATRNPVRQQAGKSRGNRKPDRPSEQVFTADVPNQPLGAVLDHFAKQLGLQLRIDHASLQDAGVSLDQLVSFRVENATFDELFEAALAPVNCTHERQANVLKVWAKR